MVDHQDRLVAVRQDARAKARKLKMDLIEVNRAGRVCRLRDTNAHERAQRDKEKQVAPARNIAQNRLCVCLSVGCGGVWVLQLKKQQQQAKAESKKIRLSPRTDSGSLRTKAGQVAKMLSKGQVGPSKAVVSLPVVVCTGRFWRCVG